jgi:hypothetical protein
MADQLDAGLLAALRDVAERIRRYQGRNLLEEDTKASLIEPVLEALGWNIREPDEVRHEFKVTKKDTPVDYALAILRQPKLFVEAKSLGATLSDSRWVAQVLGYATVAGVEWCILTDGDEYRFYNASAPVHADEKLFRKVKLSEGNEVEAARILGLISRSNMEGDILRSIWESYFVDRTLKQVLREMLEMPDRGLVRLIRRRAPKLTPKQVIQSLHRLDVRIDSPAAQLEKPRSPKPPPDDTRKKKLQETARKARSTRRSSEGVTLKDLIAAGLSALPARLFRKYKGHDLESNLLPDGAVEFQENRLRLFLNSR